MFDLPRLGLIILIILICGFPCFPCVLPLYPHSLYNPTKATKIQLKILKVSPPNSTAAHHSLCFPYFIPIGLISSRHYYSHLTSFTPYSLRLLSLCLGFCLKIPWVLDCQTPDIEVITDCHNDIDLYELAFHSNLLEMVKLTTKLP